MENQTEIRIVRDGELRAAENRTIRGYSAVFDADSLPINERHRSFIECIRRGAFLRTIAEDDIRALHGHDVNQLLGRTKAGTLDLAEDGMGLRTTIRLPRTSLAEDVYENVRVGNLTGFSFRFEARKDNWTNGGQRRELLDVKLSEVSLVSFPCYPTTSAEARGVGLPSDAEILVYAGVVPTPISDSERERLRLRLALLQRL